ncbi:MAG: FAD:protein FMN transferase [Halobaculum sp.]
MSTATVYERFGQSWSEFRCCDTQFVARAAGVRTQRAVDEARATAQRIERQLDAFDEESAVAELAREGVVENEHVARVVRRGVAYYEQTDGVFDIHQGRVEHELKSFLDGETASPPETFDTGAVRVDGPVVETNTPLDLNGLAKGYIVDRAAATLDGLGRTGFVSGGGDSSPPTGPVAVESPYGDERPIRTLDTDWAVATSGGYRRQRDGVDHLYDPTTEHVGSRHDSVTVVAQRDCTEADAAATTLAALPPDDARVVAAEWAGVEALLVHDGRIETTAGFHDHVHDRARFGRWGDRS